MSVFVCLFFITPPGCTPLLALGQLGQTPAAMARDKAVEDERMHPLFRVFIVFSPHGSVRHMWLDHASDRSRHVTAVAAPL